MMMPPFDTTTYLVDEKSICTSTTVTTTNSSSSSLCGKDGKLVDENEKSNNQFSQSTKSLSTEAITMEESLYSENEYYEESDDAAEDELGYEDRENSSVQQGRYCQYDGRRNSADSSNCSEKYGNGKNGSSSLVGGWLSDFRSLAICIKDTAGDVASFVHTTALTVAHEITMLDDEYQQQQEELRLREQEHALLQQEQQPDVNENYNTVHEIVGEFKFDRIHEKEQDPQVVGIKEEEKEFVTDVCTTERYKNLSNENSEDDVLSHGSQNSLINMDDIDDDISINSDYYDSDNENEDNDKLLNQTSSSIVQKVVDKPEVIFDPMIQAPNTDRDDDNDDDSYIFCDDSDNTISPINKNSSNQSPKLMSLFPRSIQQQQHKNVPSLTIPSAPTSTNSFGSLVMVDGTLD
jgi:hypothetical protein